MATTPPFTEDYEPREDKLPDWVQRKLGLLRQRLADEKKTSAALRGDVGETDTLIHYFEVRPDLLLPKGSEIFFLPDLAHPDQQITCKVVDGQVIVHASGSGSQGMIVRPRMSNGIAIELGN